MQQFEFVNSIDPYLNKNLRVRRWIITHVVNDTTRQKRLNRQSLSKSHAKVAAADIPSRTFSSSTADINGADR
ncbi:hypothetical protein MMC14_008835, partial [Varicellaria rhodocarpa]|nr:hypothetical protein [Varicellaria rhodocarpa]